MQCSLMTTRRPQRVMKMSLPRLLHKVFSQHTCGSWLLTCYLKDIDILGSTVSVFVCVWLGVCEWLCVYNRRSWQLLSSNLHVYLTRRGTPSQKINQHQRIPIVPLGLVGQPKVRLWEKLWHCWTNVWENKRGAQTQPMSVHKSMNQYGTSIFA